MEYTIIVNERSYDLPKKTLAVVDKLDDALKVDASNLNIRQKFEKLHRFIRDLVGDEAAKKMFGSDDITEIDLSEVTLVVKKVVDAYDKPITDYDAAKNASAFDSLPIEKIVSLGKAVDKMAHVPLRKV